MRIAFVTSEAVPFAKTGGLADVAGALTKEMARRGHDVTLFLPRYRGVADASTPTIAAADLAVPVGSRRESLTVHEVTTDGVRVLFMGHDGFFDRPELYRDPETGSDWKDNDERFIFFSRAVLETCRALDWYPEILHANDWQSAMLPVYLGTLCHEEAAWAGTRTLFTVHNIAYQGLFPAGTFEKLGLDADLWHPGSAFEYWGKINFLKLGLEFAESLSTVSPRYAQEITESNEYGFGMEGILARRRRDLTGIINGIDYEIWNPETDPHIAAHYSDADLSGKQVCKRALQSELGLPARDVPLLGIVSRLADQKGFDLIDEVATDLLARKLQLVVLGTGDAKYHELFKKLAANYPEQVGAALAFDNGLAHRIEAGSDFFLMPSRYEPCGLNQLYSLRYGTIPVVRATGGLADTVKPYAAGEGTGFVFEAYTGAAMLAAIDAALAAFAQPKSWRALVDRAMAQDFSWSAAAEMYEDLYRCTQAKPRRSLPVVTG
jgi:starch synthase